MGADPLHFDKKWKSQFAFIETRHVEEKTINGSDSLKELFNFYFKSINKT